MSAIPGARAVPMAREAQVATEPTPAEHSRLPLATVSAILSARARRKVVAGPIAIGSKRRVFQAHRHAYRARSSALRARSSALRARKLAPRARRFVVARLESVSLGHRRAFPD